MSSRVRRAGLAVFAVALALTGAVYGVARSTAANAAVQLTAPQLVADMGAGWNLGNQLEATANGYPSETAWGQPTVTQALIDKVRAAGFKTIRIPVSYLGYIGPGPNYTINAAWLNRVQEVVNYAYNRGLHVLINMHGDGYKSVNGSWLICDSSSQTTIKAKYEKAWQQIANRFKNYDQRLILESMNEEFDGQYGHPDPTVLLEHQQLQPDLRGHRTEDGWQQQFEVAARCRAGTRTSTTPRGVTASRFPPTSTAPPPFPQASGGS